MTIASDYIQDVTADFDLTRFADGTTQGGFNNYREISSCLRAYAKGKYGGTQVALIGGTKAIFQFSDRSRVEIRKLVHWLQVREVNSGFSAEDEYKITQSVAELLEKQQSNSKQAPMIKPVKFKRARTLSSLRAIQNRKNANKFSG